MRTAILALGVLALLVCPVVAQNSLYDQEGTVDDGYAAIDASGQAPAGSTAASNWKYQYGSASWTGVYGHNGWIEIDSDGDPALDVEADIEMYYTESVSDNKIYFHLGNIYSATDADKTAYVTGSFTTNNGMWIGVSFDGTSKDESSFEKDGEDYTGRIFDAMVGSRHVYGGDISEESFDIEILLDWGAGWTVPGSYGDGAHSTITDTLWWLVDGGAAGSYNYQWRVRLLPEAHQADGNYNLDPTFVAAPVL